MSDLHFGVAGAEGPKRYFSRMTRAELAHAYLFSGPAGVGKKTFARRLAQSLLCEAPHPHGVLGYDGTCTSCKLFSAGDATRHPDFLEHVGTLKIGEGDGGAGFYESDDLTARDLVRLLSMQSYEGGMRVLLLGDLDFATHHAANALLKFFEEPPSGVVLMITTATPARILPTIRSRVIELVFPPLAAGQVSEVLSGLGYASEDVARAVKITPGSVSGAIAAIGGDEQPLRALVADWFFEAVSGGTPQTPWATRDTLEDGLNTIKMLVRDWLVLGLGGVELCASDYEAELRRLGAIDIAASEAILARVAAAQRVAQSNVSPAMVSDLVRMAITGAATTRSA